jgi:hypothetical protein
MMLRVTVDPTTHEAAGLPEFIAGGRQWDDFLIDEQAGVAYVTTHRENTIDRVRLSHDGNRDGNTVVAGDPFTDILVGPSAGRWGRAPGQLPEHRLCYQRRRHRTAARWRVQNRQGAPRRIAACRLSYQHRRNPPRLAEEMVSSNLVREVR